MYSWIHIYLILILSISTSSVSSAILCPFQLPECQCYLKTVTCSDLKFMPPLVSGNNVFVVDEVYFRGGSITSIPDKSLPSGLSVFECDGTPLVDISEQAFQASANTLHKLSLRNAQFKRLPSLLLKLTNLTTLSIRDTFIEQWDLATLTHIATTVRSLILTNVGLNEWPSWFSIFHSITEVDFAQNSIQFVPDDAFNFTKDILKQLTLNTCNLTQVPNALSTLQNLNYLDFSNNSISDVNGKQGIEQLISYPYASTLETLIITSLGLTNIPNLSHTTKLLGLFLSNNDISDATTDTYPPSLRYLYLDGNKLTSVPAVFANLTNLGYLNLASNQITEINLDQLSLTLIRLDLGYNNISQLSDAVLSNSSLKLQLVSLTSNPITNISVAAFRNLRLLNKLNLEGTHLTRIPLALTSLTELTTLTLPTLPCPDPPAAELIVWFKSLKGLILVGTCSSGGEIDDYLSNARMPESTTHSDASALMFSLWCRFASWLLLLIFLKSL